MQKSQISLKKILHRLFIEENPMEPKLQLLSQLMESIIYVTIINGIHFSEVIRVFGEGSIVFGTLFLIFLVKFTYGITFRFGISLIVLNLLVNKTDSWLIPNYLLLAIIISVHFFSSISFDYSSLSMQVESRVSNKLMRMFLLMGNIVVLAFVQTPTYVHLVSAVLFLGLLWSKERSLMKSEEYRAIALRFYLCAACEHLRLFLTAFLPFASTLPAVAFSFFFSQSLFALLVRCRPPLSCHQLLAKEEYLRLAFLLLSYTHSSVYDHKLEDFITSFVGERIQLQEAKLKKAEPKISYSSSQILQYAILSLLCKSNCFLQTLLCVQLHASRGRVLLAMEILEKAKKELSSFDFLQTIMLLRAKDRLKGRFSHSFAQVTFRHEEAWKNYLDFQQLLHKAASQHLRFNIYLKRTEIQLSKIKEICLKILQLDEKVTTKFEEVREDFAASTELFVAFLILVLGDYQKAESILNRQRLNEFQLIDGFLHQKLFIRLNISVDGLTISRVGFNAQELLGYNRDQLQGQTLERLIPPFFRSQHQQISKTFVHDALEKRMLFQKNTVIHNGQGTYNACSIVMKLTMREDELSYEGYIHVFDNGKYNFDSFFIVDTDGIVLQNSKQMINEEDTKGPLKVEQIFQGTIGGTLIRTNSQKLYQIYDAIIFYSGENPFYFYAKRMVNKMEIKVQDQNSNSLKEKTAPIMQSKIQSSDSHKQKAEKEEDQMQEYIKNKEICVLFVVIVLMILGLFVSEYLLILSATVKYNNQNFTISNTLNLIQYYNISSKLEINLIYLNFRDSYNYTNSFFQLDMENTAINMHFVSQKLKRFNQGKYSTSTFNPAIKYQESNYQLILMLVAQAFSYQHFPNDIFMKKAALDQSKTVIPVQATQSTTDYRVSIVSLMNSFVQNDIFYENLSFWVNNANIFMFLFLAIRLFWKLKQVEEYALNRRCSGTFHIRKIKDISEFLKEITLEYVPMDKLNLEMQVYQIIANNQNNLSTLMSQASLIRESTLKNISMDGEIPLETLNKTGFLQNMEKAEVELKTVEKSPYIFRKTKSYFTVLITFGLFMAILIILNAANETINYTNKNLDELSSLLSVLLLYKPAAIYSGRCVIITFNAMLQKNEKGVDTSSTYNSTIKQCQTFVTSYTFPNFPQMQFSDFSDFTAGFNKLYQQNLCSYVTCDPQYYDQLSLNFISVIKQYSLSLSPMFRATFNYTTAQMATYLTSTNKHYIDMLFYTEDLVRSFIANLMTSYVNSYSIFMTNLFYSKVSYAFSMIGITAVGLVMFLVFVWHIKREQNRFIKMIKLYGPDI